MPGAWISFKGPEVRVASISPRVFRAIADAAVVYGNHGCNLIVTSLNDGEHRKNSLHYSGRAVDLRTHNVPAALRPVIAAELREVLGSEFDVVHEKAGTPNEHIHVEWDPKP